MNIIFTICGRAGSKGFRNKNLKELKGVKLVYYSLAAIKGFMDRYPNEKVLVALNTDSKLLEDIVKSQRSVQVKYIERKPQLAGDTVAKVDVIRDTFLACDEFVADVVIDLDITSPMRRVKDIENIILEYKKGMYDLVFSVVKARRSPYFNMVEYKSDGFYRRICEGRYTTRQQAPVSYEMNASIYAYSPLFLKRNIDKTIIDYNCGISVMPDYCVLDIDSEEDFEMMQYLFEYYLKDEGLSQVYQIAESFNE